MAEENNWTQFSVRININADRQQLYDAWTTQAGMERWFLRFAGFYAPDGVQRKSGEPVQQGDTYHWRWHGYPDDTDERGTIPECNGKDRFVFIFGKAGTCIVSIYQEQGETIVALKQENIPDDEKGKFNFHIGCKTGWTFYLANLKSIYEGGTDLRNRNEKLQHMLNA